MITEDILPDKPSELIRVALKDLEAVEASDKYGVSMVLWHAQEKRGGPCFVCLAGAVMAARLGASPNEDLGPEDFPAGVSGKLQALDAFREGHVNVGFMMMGLSPPADWPHREMSLYGEDAQAFKTDLRQLANDLEEVGL